MDPGAPRRDAGPGVLEPEIQDKVGVQFSRAPRWEPYMVEDRNLITGQNPNSAIVLAGRLLKEFA